jgi:hypothetical protein
MYVFSFRFPSKGVEISKAILDFITRRSDDLKTDFSNCDKMTLLCSVRLSRAEGDRFTIQDRGAVLEL